MFLFFLSFFISSSEYLPSPYSYKIKNKFVLSNLEPVIKFIDEKWGRNYLNAFNEAFPSIDNVSTPIIQNLARMDYPPAVFFLGEMYLYGVTVKRNFTKAYELITKSAELGFEESYASLAFIHKLNLLDEDDDMSLIKADALYNIAFEKSKSIEAFFNLLVSAYANKESLENNLDSLLFVNRFVDTVDVSRESISRLNSKYEFDSSEKDEDKFALYKYMSARNDKNANVDMGAVYLEGMLGQEKDMEKAAEYLEQVQDVPRAVGLEGRALHKMGRLEEADEKLNFAAHEGDADAMLYLGVTSTDTDAKNYFTKLGSEKGNQLCKESLLINKMRELEATECPDFTDIANNLTNNVYTRSILYAIPSLNYNLTMAVKYVLQFERQLPFFANGKVAKHWYENGNKKGALLLWIRLGLLGNTDAAYNAGMLLIKKDNRLFGKTRKWVLKTARRMFNIAAMDESLSLNRYIAHINGELGKIEKAEELLESTETEDIIENIIENTGGFFGTNPKKVLDLYTKLIDDGKVGKVAAILLFPRVSRCLSQAPSIFIEKLSDMRVILTGAFAVLFSRLIYKMRKIISDQIDSEVVEEIKE